MMNIELRPEQPADYCETERVTREAFWNHFSPGCDEHYLMHILRDCPAFVPQLDYVAVVGDKLVGNITYCKSVVKGDDGNEYEVLGIGPVSVLPEYQGKGIGTKLIEHTLELARKLNHRAVFLYGDPDYYSRHGFVPAERYGIRTSDNMYAVALQACGLYPNALLGIAGRYLEHPIYEMDSAASAEFDKQFPVREKVSGTPSQKRFDEIVAMRRSAD